MAKARPNKRDLPQLSVRVSEDTMRRLAALQRHYETQGGRMSAVTQAEAIEQALRDAAVSVGIEQGKKGGR